MRARLLMEYTDDFGFPVNKARVVRWHVAEGARVRAGQPLCDLKVEEALVPAERWRAISMIRQFDRVPEKISQVLGSLGNGDGAHDDPTVEPVEWVNFLRVSAAESGVLEEIGEAGLYTRGDVLASMRTNGRDGSRERAFAAVSSSLEMEPVGALDRSLQVSSEAEDEPEFQRAGPNYLTFWKRASASDRIGLFMNGGCDLNTIFAAAPIIRELYDGVCCILHEGSISDSRSDVLLYNLDHEGAIDPDLASETVTKLRLPANYFEPSLFEPTFRAEGVDGIEEFPKTAILLGNGADLTRTVYRHKRHGFLVDPGGGWLNQPLHSFLGDLSVVKWFRSEFESIGKLEVEESYANFARILETLRRRFDVPILMFNVAELEPGSRTHNLQLARNAHALRRREFNIALAELSREFDISIIDVDRIINRIGIRAQLDWNHVHPKVHVVIASEAVRIMCERGVFASPALQMVG